MLINLMCLFQKKIYLIKASKDIEKCIEVQEGDFEMRFIRIHVF